MAFTLDLVCHDNVTLNVTYPIYGSSADIAIHFTLASHNLISTNFNAFKTHWHAFITNTSKYQHITPTLKNYTGFQSNKESITNSVFSHTKHLQINNLHIFTIVFHFLHTLFLHDLLIHSFYPIPYVRSSLGKRAFSVIGPRLWNSLPPDTRNSNSLPTFRSRLKTHLFKIAFPPKLFPISLDCLPGF